MQESSATTAIGRLERLAVGALLLTPALPLVFAPGVVYHYITVRAVLFRLLIVVAAWCGAVIALLNARGTRWHLGITGVVLGALVATGAVSAFSGPGSWHSWFGDFERMGGVVAWLTYFAYYGLLLRFLRRETWMLFLKIAAGAGAAAAMFAWFEFYGAFPSLGHEVRGATSSTIGNSGLFAAFAAFSMAFSLILFGEASTRRTRALYAAFAAVNATGIWFAQNRSTVIGIGIGSVVAALAYLGFLGRSGRRLVAIGALAVTVAAGAVIALRSAARADLLPVLPGVTARLATGAVAGDPARIILWRAAWRSFGQRPILGWGPENHHLVWSASYDPAIYGLDPRSRFDRTHNMYLEVLATTGIIGALATLALWVAIVLTILRARACGGLSPPVAAVLIGINVAYAAYLVFWFYDFNSTMLWIAAAAFASSRALSAQRQSLAAGPAQAGVPAAQQQPGDGAVIHEPPVWRKVGLIGVTSLAAISILYVHVFETMRAARAIEKLATRPPPLTRGIAHLRLLGRSPAPQSVEIFATASSYLHSALQRDNAAVRGADAAPVELRREAVNITLALAERELRRDPRNEWVALNAGRVALLGSVVFGDPSLQSVAVSLGERAVELNPQSVQVRIVLANFYLLAGDRRRTEEQFTRAAAIFPAYLEPQRIAARSYAGVGAYRDAARWLHTAQENGATIEAPVVTRIAQALDETGSGAEALGLLRAHVRLRLGPLAFWSPAVGTAGAAVAEEVAQARLLGKLERAHGIEENAAAAEMAVEQICRRRPCREVRP